MLRRFSFGFVCLLSLVIAACEGGAPTPTPAPVIPTSPSNLPNPASAYCEQNGGRLEMREEAPHGLRRVPRQPRLRVAFAQHARALGAPRRGAVREQEAQLRIGGAQPELARLRAVQARRGSAPCGIAAAV